MLSKWSLPWPAGSDNWRPSDQSEGRDYSLPLRITNVKIIILLVLLGQ